MKKEGIYIYGAREHNLKSINTFIPRNKITIVTGLSGSGKSSLVFDTIYAEGQRRYVESLSSYARFFISQIKKPDLDAITGLSPAVAIDQRSINTSPRSTVGTVTEIYDYLRLLFARLGTPYCIQHQQALKKSSIDKITEEIMTWPKNSRFLILAPVAEGKKGEFLKEFQGFLSSGYTQAKVDGKWLELAEAKKLSKRKDHFIDLLVDRLSVESRFIPRLKESLQKAADLTKGRIKVELINLPIKSLTSKGLKSKEFYLDKSLKKKSMKKKDQKMIETSKHDQYNSIQSEKNKLNIKHYSLHATCPVCLAGFPEMEPKLFSFNNPKGACSKCNGLGYLQEEEEWREESEWMEEDMSAESLIFPDSEKKHHKDTEIKQTILSNQTNTAETNNMDIEKDRAVKMCPLCKGTRLNSFALSVRIQDKNIAQLSSFSIEKLIRFCSRLKFPSQYKLVADKILEKLNSDLGFLNKMGLGYLSLDRPSRTLSGGEAQRVRLMSQISSPLIGVLYVLDEPSIGLHPQDQDRLLKILFHIRDRGNTVLIVEHDEKTIRSAEHLIDLGPVAGKNGGHIIAEGSLQDIIKSPQSITGHYLSGKKKISLPKKSTTYKDKVLEIRGARGNNLKNINVKIPLSCLVGVTGVSGSGKSTLVIDTLYRALQKQLNQLPFVDPQLYREIKGLEFLDKVVAINQKPIGRTPRSVPATYVGIMSPIRNLMAQVPAACVRGYTPGDFSFNIKGGRCEKCSGTGQIKQEMLFLPSAILPCDICQGRRYSNEILSILYKNKNIHDILSMDIISAKAFFAHHFLIQQQLQLLEQVGLGYLTLGQNSMTLSGGEAQRIKLTRELAKKNTGRTLYILDEPTTGLHFKDIEQLVFVLKKLTEKGSTVIVIEHQMDVIKSCDYIIDLGPGGGRHGGKVVAEGTPEQVARSNKSATAPFLKEALSV
ncbi:MAG: excinuclease ABC subunit UvrA [Bdellovibrionales bacterium]|nr:excinuclease ABC subunit UvrA [Bdellovibrionales bacterium]